MKKILAVDDDPHILRAMIEFFNPDNFEMDSIFKGSEALRTVCDLSPDLLKRTRERNSDQLVMRKDEILQPESFPVCREEATKIGVDFREAKETYSEIFSRVLESLRHRIFCASQGNVCDYLIWALEKSLISSALKCAKENQVEAAKPLGICRNIALTRLR